MDITFAEKNRYSIFRADFLGDSQPGEFIDKLDDFIAAGRILKDDKTTTVAIVSIHGKDRVVKRFNNQGLLHSLRHTIKGSRAGKCWANANMLLAIDVPTPRPLAFVEIRNRHLLEKSYYISDYVAGTTLRHLLQDENISTDQKQQTLRQVESLLNKMHNRRITHGDMKHTNIILTEAGMVFTDLDALTRHLCWISWKLRTKRDFKRYFKDTRTSPAGLTLAGSYRKVRHQSWQMVVHRDVSLEQSSALISPYGKDRPSSEKFVRVNSSASTAVFVTRLNCNGSEVPVYLKYELYRSGWDSVKYLFRHTRARQAFSASLMFRQNGFNAPLPLALLEKRTGPFTTKGALAVAQISATQQLNSKLAALGQCCRPQTLKQKRQLIRDFAETVARLHNKGIIHADLRLGNVLCTGQGSNETFWFIDNERAKQYTVAPKRLIKKNLVQVNMFRTAITNADRARFFKAYSTIRQLTANQSRALAGEVLKRTAERLKKKRPKTGP